MASPSLSATAAILCFCAFLVSPGQSLNCTSQMFTNKLFANCSDLPTLSSYLHWTYNATNSSLSVAFVATPANPGGWISWGINPTATGMVGTQSLVAYGSNGSVVVKTYNLVSYGNISQSKLSFDVWDLSAQEVDGEMTIFASVKVPEKAEMLNQVWQVGPSVSSDGVPAKHEFAPANLAANGTLSLTMSSGNGTAAAGPSSTNSTGDSRKLGAGLFVSSLAILVGGLIVA